MIPDNRDKTGKFQPGKTGNPGGRPSLPEEFKLLARSASIPALKTCIEIVNNPKCKPNERVKAAEIVLDRAWGKPIQGVDLSFDPKKPFSVEIKIIE